MIKLLADIALGIFSVIFTSRLFQIEINFTMILVGITFALLPDLDTVIHWLKTGKLGGKFNHRHRDLLHIPLLYIPIGSVLIVWFGFVWLFLFIFNSFMHFFHDSFGIGWGIKWFYPFSEKSYKLFSFRRLIISWNEEELEKIAEQYGDENWIKNVYLRPTLISITELVFFLISLIVLFFCLRQ